MWLFDDILKKPVNQTPPSDPLGSSLSDQSGWQSGTQGWGQPQQTDTTGTIFIQKSSEEVVFGPKSEALSIEKANAPSPMPTVHAEADTSSILISTPAPIQAETMLNIAPAIVATPVMIESVSMTNLPEQASSASVTPLISSVTLVDIAPLAIAPNEAMIISTPAPLIVNQSVPSIDAVAPIAQTASAPIVTNSIFDSIMSPPEVVAMPIPQVVVPAPVVAATEVPAAPAPVMAAPVVFSSTHNFSTPREFIEKNLVNIDTMIVNIDARHNAKEIEEEGYKMEKLRFTELERSAHTEKIIMDKERDHAIHMKKILETELERDKANKATEETRTNHVESTLTEIGTEHPIHRHVTHKKAESHTHEDSPVAA